MEEPMQQSHKESMRSMTIIHEEDLEETLHFNPQTGAKSKKASLGEPEAIFSPQSRNLNLV